METKVCSCCKIEKKLDEFRKNKTGKLGRNNQCKLCASVSQKKYIENKVKENPNYWKEWYIKKLEKNPDYNKKVYNREKVSGQSDLRRKRWRKNNPNYEKKGTTQYEKVLERRKSKYYTDEFFKLKVNLRNTIMRFMHSKKKYKTEKILGCSYSQFILHIQNKFQKGMTWDNHGRNGWHLDHIIPLSSAKTEEDLYKLNHYTNFQPLWEKDNLQKSDKIIEYQNHDSI